MLRKNYWHIELQDGRTFEFRWTPTKGNNPLDEIKEYHHPNGKDYILDISELRDSGEYPIYEEENSFVLVPKTHIKKMFYVE